MLVFWYRKLRHNLFDIKQRRQPSGWPPIFCMNAECALFWIQVFIYGAHIPPYIGYVFKWPPEIQLIVFLRLINLVKVMNHNHPMRFGHLIDMLSHISPIELDDSDFILKVSLHSIPPTQK